MLSILITKHEFFQDSTINKTTDTLESYFWDVSKPFLYKNFQLIVQIRFRVLQDILDSVGVSSQTLSSIKFKECSICSHKDQAEDKRCFVGSFLSRKKLEIYCCWSVPLLRPRRENENLDSPLADSCFCWFSKVFCRKTLAGIQRSLANVKFGSL